jgi:hypothetical protein
MYILNPQPINNLYKSLLSMSLLEQYAALVKILVKNSWKRAVGVQPVGARCTVPLLAKILLRSLVFADRKLRRVRI